ncbi:MAG: chalcone isomerase family protein [Proteobacteria bacterium]|nr:chalcone isomerase family protein [Pseudomonadota bacterium]
MKNIFLIFLLLVISVPLYGLNVSGVNISETITLNNNQLKLNGYGIRKKWFVKVYVASLYTTKKVTNYDEAVSDGSDKVIRLDFLHKVEKNKVTDTIKEAFQSIAPDIPESEAGKKFFSQFNSDFNVGDTLELVLLSDGTVITKHNNKVLGIIKSNRLAFGLLSIYIGNKPVDEELKKGMLGQK